MEELEEFETLLGYKFKNKDLLACALTHSSYSGDYETRLKNEKLEFLGDAVLNAIITFLLFKRFKDKDEGFLSNARSFLVRRETLSEIGKTLNLTKFIRSENSLSIYESKVVSNLVEALIGAIYLDGGIRKASSVIRKLFSPYFKDEKLTQKNPKNVLQEYSQKELGVLPTYRCIRKGKNGFLVRCKVGKDLMAKGRGRTKKEAEIDAARNILEMIKKS